MKEIWTTEAKTTFAKNIKYLKRKCAINEVNAFMEKSFEVIDLIKSNPNIGQYDKNWDANKFLIVPQMYLFYEINRDNLVLITFWNNYQKPFRQVSSLFLQ